LKPNNYLIEKTNQLLECLSETQAGASIFAGGWQSSNNLFVEPGNY